jgi:hypothetical protein
MLTLTVIIVKSLIDFGPTSRPPLTEIIGHDRRGREGNSRYE